MVKKFLDERQVGYEFRDVLGDEAAAREFAALGGRVPPLLVVGDERFEGFRPEAIDEALARLDNSHS